MFHKTGMCLCSNVLISHDFYTYSFNTFYPCFLTQYAKCLNAGQSRSAASDSGLLVCWLKTEAWKLDFFVKISWQKILAEQPFITENSVQGLWVMFRLPLRFFNVRVILIWLPHRAWSTTCWFTLLCIWFATFLITSWSHMFVVTVGWAITRRTRLLLLQLRSSVGSIHYLVVLLACIFLIFNFACAAHNNYFNAPFLPHQGAALPR